LSPLAFLSPRPTCRSRGQQDLRAEAVAEQKVIGPQVHLIGETTYTAESWGKE